MRRILVGAALCLFAPIMVTPSAALTSAWPATESTDDDDRLPRELRPGHTTFAYRARHGATALPAPTLNALWFPGEDRELPRTPVTEPIVVVPAQVVRAVPSRNALCNHAVNVAAEHNLPAPFFANLIQQESGFKSHVVSPAGAQGIAQFMPRVARAYGLENPFEPVHALSVSAKFLRELLGQFGNIGLAAAAYNAGPKRVQDWMARRGKLPEETRNYVRNITGHPAERWARVSARTEETVLPAHARCPGMPVMEVSIPEAAPVKVAKGKAKGRAEIRVADASGELPKMAAAKEAGPKMPKAETPNTAAAKPYTLASLSPGKAKAVISNGKIQIIAPEKGSKTPAKVAAAKPSAKPAAKADKKVAAKSSAKPGKPAAKSLAKPGGKGVKVAAAR